MLLFSHHTNYLENLIFYQCLDRAFWRDKEQVLPCISLMIAFLPKKQRKHYNKIIWSCTYSCYILFRLFPKCLEISLALVSKKLGLIKLRSVSSELLKILLENELAYQVVKFISSLCCLIILLFKHVMERIKWLTIFKVLIKVLKKSRCLLLVTLQGPS